MKRNTKLLIGAGAVLASAAAAAAASHTITKFMINMAMDRHKPKSFLGENRVRAKIRGTAYQEMFLQDLSAAAEKLKNSGCERVEIKSRDGITLVGHLQMCPRPRRVILAMHGWRSSWDQDFGMISDFWWEATESLLTPMITAFFSSHSGFAEAKAQACLVQPGVLSLG